MRTFRGKNEAGQKKTFSDKHDCISPTFSPPLEEVIALFFFAFSHSIELFFFVEIAWAFYRFMRGEPLFGKFPSRKAFPSSKLVYRSKVPLFYTIVIPTSEPFWIFRDRLYLQKDFLIPQLGLPPPS